MPLLTRLVPLCAALLLLSASLPPAPTAGVERPLRYLAGASGTLDPAYIADAGDVQLLLQLYAGLTRLDEDGDPYPSLAERWSVSEDGLTYTFVIREGLRFSDGSPLDATDVRRSWLRMVDPETGSSAPDVLSVVVGASERLDGRVDEEEVGVEAPDPLTLVVRLRHPAGYFPELVATPAAFVVPRHAATGQEWQTPDDFVGSGPYVVAALVGDDLQLRANPHYVAGPPPIEQIDWLAGVEGGTVAAFTDEELDLAQVGWWDASWLAYDAELGRNLHRAPALTTSFFAFDTSQPPFDDPRVRRAFALALDSERLVELALSRSAQPAASLVPPALWPADWPAGPRTDPDEARRLLDEAGYADASDLGPITLNATGLGAGPAVAVWRERLGVEIVVERMRFEDYLVEVEQRTPPIYTINWIADYPSPHALYGLLLLPGATSNYGGWRDDEFVRLLEAAAALTDPQEQAAAYAAVEEHVRAEVPVIPWAYSQDWWLVRSGLRGLGSLTIGLLDFGRVSWDR
jgi:oligopeptide transport system substrate-binding protein